MVIEEANEGQRGNPTHNLEAEVENGHVCNQFGMHLDGSGKLNSDSFAFRIGEKPGRWIGDLSVKGFLTGKMAT
ncbi:hypothetical protein COLO4_36504 [Corchorus olitorius]|uniref:Uncharacterized protein n=1 Tax=Corchorus olitorius TaxID=93759 RepID=A0A1R3G8I3_9ROSI|nr:hypothetical protein COLO4_36504 [Corchorus olitorius]